MTRTWRRNSLMLCRIACAHRQNLFPVLPVAVGDLHGHRRADGPPMPHSGEDMSGVRLDAHAAAAPVPLLAPPQLSIDECLVDFEACGKPLHQRNQGLAVRFTR